jgi:acetyltransferase-like isoleucine patch superfamily enzyme
VPETSLRTRLPLFSTSWWRVAWTMFRICLVQGLVCGLAVLPVLLVWTLLVEWTGAHPAVRAIAFSALIVPSYVAFALCLMVLSAAATRLTGARTPPIVEMRIADLGWPLMKWVEHMVATHIVRVLAGTLFRGSPIWTAYLRLSGARIGRRVHVNTLFISDHNLLEFGDDVVIGSDVHVSGHTVEGGVVKTAGVRLGPGVTIGLGTVIDIGVDVGAHCQVGALSLIPKHTTLAADSVYVGIPVTRIG